MAALPARLCLSAIIAIGYQLSVIIASYRLLSGLGPRTCGYFGVYGALTKNAVGASCWFCSCSVLLHGVLEAIKDRVPLSEIGGNWKVEGNEETNRNGNRSAMRDWTSLSEIRGNRKRGTRYFERPAQSKVFFVHFAQWHVALSAQ